MKFFGAIFLGTLALLFGVVSVLMVWQYGVSRSEAPLASYIMGAFGVLAVVFSMGGFTFSRSLRAAKRGELANLILAGVIVAEGCIVFCELGFHGMNIVSAELRRKAETVEAKVNLDQIENAQRVIKELQGVPSSKEIRAGIALELARVVKDRENGRRPLSIAADGCNNANNLFYAECGKVLELRRKLATAEQFEAAELQVGTTTSEKITGKASVNAGVEAGADMTGFSAAALSHTQLLFFLAFMAVGRLTTVPVLAMLYEGEQKPPVAETVEVARVETLDLYPTPTVNLDGALSEDVVDAVRQIEAKVARAPAKRKKAVAKTGRKVLAPKAAENGELTLSEIVEAARKRLPPGDYEFTREIMEEVRKAALDLEQAGRGRLEEIRPETVAFILGKRSDVEKLPRGGGGDRLIRYRLHGSALAREAAA